MPRSRAVLAITGAAPVPVPPPMPAVTKHIWTPERWSRISSITSSAAARPTSGCEPAPSPSVTCTPIWMMRSAFDMVSACASVFATTKSTPWRPALIMLLTALPPAPPTPNTVMRGFSSRMSGIFRLMVMVASSFMCGRRRRPPPAGPPRAVAMSAVTSWLCVCGPSETLTKPLSDAGEIASRAIRRVPPVAGIEVFEMRRLRINEQAGRRREGGALCRVRQPRDSQRPPDAHLPAEYAGGKFGKSGHLTGAAGKNHAPARFRRERRSREPVAHHLQNFLDARLNDVNERGPRHELRLLALVADGRNLDHVSFVRSTDENTAIECL